jgi:YHS domain-containing protein
MAIDPVCRMTVEPQKAAASMEYQGSTYYFCSKGCHQEFTAHPDKYAAAAANAAVTHTATIDLTNSGSDSRQRYSDRRQHGNRSGLRHDGG